MIPRQVEGSFGECGVAFGEGAVNLEILNLAHSFHYLSP